MTIVLERRRFLTILATALVENQARAEPYCRIPPIPVECFAECKNNTVLTSSCDTGANQCRSSCDIYQPGQVPGHVLNELITRDPIIGAGPKVQITPNDLRGAVDTASSALTAFLFCRAEGGTGAGSVLGAVPVPVEGATELFENNTRRRAATTIETFNACPGLYSNAAGYRDLPKGRRSSNGR